MKKPYRVKNKGLRSEVLFKDDLLCTIGTFTNTKSVEKLLNAAYCAGYTTAKAEADATFAFDKANGENL